MNKRILVSLLLVGSIALTGCTATTNDEEENNGKDINVNVDTFQGMDTVSIDDIKAVYPEWDFSVIEGLDSVKYKSTSGTFIIEGAASQIEEVKAWANTYAPMNPITDGDTGKTVDDSWTGVIVNDDKIIFLDLTVPTGDTVFKLVLSKE